MSKYDEEAKKRRTYNANPIPYEVVFPASKNYCVDIAKEGSDETKFWVHLRREKACCDKPNKTTVKTNTMHFYVCKNCKADLGDV